MTALLARHDATAKPREAARVRAWFGASGDAAERRAERARVGTVAQQRAQYQAYIHQLAVELEAATNGNHVTREMKAQHSRGGGMSIERILTSSPDTIRKHLSAEALEHLANRPPLSFDAWRHAHLGMTDKAAKDAYERRTSGYFSEHG